LKAAVPAIIISCVPAQRWIVVRMPTEDAAAHPYRIGNIAERMLRWLITGVHVTKQFLRVACTGEQSLGRRLRVDARTDEKKFRASAERPKFACYVRNARS
jgi:hypothetical protein